MLVGRTVKFQAVATLPIAQPVPSPSPASPTVGSILKLQQLSPFARQLLNVDWTAVAHAPAPQGSTAAPAAIPNTGKPLAWEYLLHPLPVGTAYVPPADARSIFVRPSLNELIAAAGGGPKPIAAGKPQITATPKIGDIQLKQVLEAGTGFTLTTAASKTLYFSNTVPPDQLATLVQNYAGLTPDAAQYLANSLLAFFRAPAGHAVLYGLAATGAGMVLLQATHEKPTLSRSVRWAIAFFAGGVLIYLVMRYLGWVT